MRKTKDWKDERIQVKDYILEVSRGIPTGRYPMNGIFEWDQAKALAAAGQKVIFASIDTRSLRRWRKWGICRYEREGIAVYEINLPIGAVSINSQARAAAFAYKILYSKIKSENGRPAVVHAHFARPIGYAAAKLKEREGYKLVVTEHESSFLSGELPDCFARQYHYTFHTADKIIAVSHALQEALARRFGIEAATIHNVVDIDSFGKRRREKKRGHFSLIAVGMLIPRKGYSTLIQAVSQSEHRREIQLQIFGEGEERGRLTAEIKKLELEENIELMGLRERDEIGRAMAAADFFVLASLGETFGVAYIEAMAAGVPVIGTKCGGPEDFITPDVGILIEAGNAERLAEALDYMCGNCHKYDRNHIAAVAYERFSPSAVAARLISEFGINRTV